MLEQTVVLVGGQTEPISQVVFICFLVEPETTFLITDRQILIRIIFLIRGGRMLSNRISYFNFFFVLATKLAFLGDGFLFCSFFLRFAVVNKVRLILVLGSPAFFLVFGVVWVLVNTSILIVRLAFLFILPSSRGYFAVPRRAFGYLIVPSFLRLVFVVVSLTRSHLHSTQVSDGRCRWLVKLFVYFCLNTLGRLQTLVS